MGTLGLSSSLEEGRVGALDRLALGSVRHAAPLVGWPLFTPSGGSAASDPSASAEPFHRLAVKEGSVADTCYPELGKLVRSEGANGHREDIDRRLEAPR